MASALLDHLLRGKPAIMLLVILRKDLYCEKLRPLDNSLQETGHLINNYMSKLGYGSSSLIKPSNNWSLD